MRWYCWIIFCIIAILSIQALPTDLDVPEQDILAIDNEIEVEEDVIAETQLLDEDDDDDNVLSITDRHLRRRKPNHHEKKKDKDDSNEKQDKSKDKTDKDDSKEKKDEKNSKKPKVTKCVCFEKKPGASKPKRPPHKQGIDLK